MHALSKAISEMGQQLEFVFMAVAEVTGFFRANPHFMRNTLIAAGAAAIVLYGTSRSNRSQSKRRPKALPEPPEKNERQSDETDPGSGDNHYVGRNEAQ